jgi:hypothetical protein
VIGPPTSNAVGLVQEAFPVAQGLLRVPVDRDNDGLDMMEAVPFARCQKTDFGERVNPRRIVGVVVVPACAENSNPDVMMVKPAEGVNE